jgi:hypothetical protein
LQNFKVSRLFRRPSLFHIVFTIQYFEEPHLFGTIGLDKGADPPLLAICHIPVHARGIPLRCFTAVSMPHRISPVRPLFISCPSHCRSLQVVTPDSDRWSDISRKPRPVSSNIVHLPHCMVPIDQKFPLLSAASSQRHRRLEICTARPPTDFAPAPVLCILFPNDSVAEHVNGP